MSFTGNLLQRYWQLLAAAVRVPVVLLIALAVIRAQTLHAQAFESYSSLPGCYTNTMTQDVSGPISLPFPLAFGFNPDNSPQFHDHIYVHRQGQVTFNNNSSISFPNIHVLGDNTNTGGTITYGTATYLGHPTFCVTWSAMESSTPAFAGLTNSFQLMLVQSLAAPGDFDMYFNFRKVSWENTYIEGRGFGVTFDAGYASGEFVTQYLPGSYVDDFTDSNPATGLINRSGDLIGNGWSGVERGRYVWHYTANPSHTISGRVVDASGNPASGIQLSLTNERGFTLDTISQTDGSYSVSVLDGTWYIDGPRIVPWPLLPNVGKVQVVVSGSNVVAADLVLGQGQNPVGTSIGPAHSCPVPGPSCITWYTDPVTLTIPASCSGGTGTFSISDYKTATLIAGGALSEDPSGSGNYTGSFGAVYPHHDYAVVTEEIRCPDGSLQTCLYDIWIDPSGLIIKKRSGPGDPIVPIEGAQATLYFVPGEFTTATKDQFSLAPCPFVNGAACELRDSLHQPLNNPIITGADGLYSWVVRPAYRYFVEATAPNCTAATTDILPVPPPWLSEDPYCVANPGDKVRCPDAWLPCAPNAADLTRCVPPLELACTTAEQWTLTVQTIGHGFVKKVPDRTAFGNGEVVTLTAVPDAGWTFSGWSGDLSGATNPATLTMTGNRTVQARFVQNSGALCDTLGHGSHHNPELKAYAFMGKRGERITVSLTGTSLKVATLVVVSGDPRHPAYWIDRSKLPNQIAVTLPASGVYYVGVVQSADSKPLAGAYCVSLQANPKTIATFTPIEPEREEVCEYLRQPALRPLLAIGHLQCHHSHHPRK